MINYSDISTNLKVIDHEITRSRLYICYELEGKEYHLECDPDEAATVFIMAGILHDSNILDGELYVRVEIEIQGSNKGKKIWIEWNEFVLSFNLDHSTARILAISYEQDKICRGHFKYFLSIPSIVTEFNNDKKVLV